MADATVGVQQPASPDHLIDNDSLTVGANTVYRQRVRLAGANAADLATITAGALTTDVADRAARLLGHVTVDTAPITQTRDDPDVAVRAGRLFLGGSGEQTLTAAGNVRLAFTNPTGSGKTAYIYRLSGGGSALAYAHLYVNPTAGVPTALRPANNLYFGYPNAAACHLYADQNLTVALGGGSDSGIDIVFGANAETTFNEYPIIIPASVTLGVNVPFTGAASGSFNLYWEEL